MEFPQVGALGQKRGPIGPTMDLTGDKDCGVWIDPVSHCDQAAEEFRACAWVGTSTAPLDIAMAGIHRLLFDRSSFRSVLTISAS
jgi:hypothetical protein